jgi:Domain of unknown function (DUF4265)
MDDVKFVTHQSPVWRERSNFLVMAKLETEPDAPPTYEQTWARRVEDKVFQVCCIPFFTYGLALGDTVSTEPDNKCQYVINRIVARSGRYCFRVWFADSSYVKNELTEYLAEIGSSVEWSSANLLAIDAEDAERASQLNEYLARLQLEGCFTFERGWVDELP